MKTALTKKAVLILVISVLTSLTTYSQTNVYHPFPVSNTMWIGKHVTGTYYQTINNYNLYISGDTIIGPYTYHKLYQNGHVSFWLPTGTPDYDYYGLYAGAFRQDILNKRVYLYKDGVDTLAYDYNLLVGDTLPPSCLVPKGFPRPYIKSVDSVLVDKQFRKRFWINGCNYALIEGIGSTFGAFDKIICPFEWHDDLYCVRMGSQIVWTSGGGNCTLTSTNEKIPLENKVAISQNPFSTVTTITSSVNLKNATLFIYDSAGKLIRQLKDISGNTITLHRDNLPSGVYFLRLNQDDKIITTEKLIITDN